MNSTNGELKSGLEMGEEEGRERRSGWARGESRREKESELERTLADREVVFFSTSSPPVFPDFPFPPVDILEHQSKKEANEESA